MVNYMWGKDVADAIDQSHILEAEMNKRGWRVFPLRMPIGFKPIDKPQSPR